MSLKTRVGKLESLIEPKNKLHVICGSEDMLDSLVEEFRQQNPDFDGILVKVVDYFKPENAGT